MKVIIVAGGTGGHFYPGLVVYRELTKKSIPARFIVRRNDFVIPLLKKENIAYSEIWAGGFHRRLDPRNLVSFLKLMAGFLQSCLIMAWFQPDTLLAMGGYLSVAPALAAKFGRVRVFLHEQNLKPGLANRFLGRLAEGVAVSFEGSRGYFKRPVVITGNPVRREFEGLPSAHGVRASFGLDPAKRTILIFGGSQGAHSLNEWVIVSLGKMTSFLRLYQFLHLTGTDDEPKVREAYQRLGVLHYVSPYCHQMDRAYAACDFVISRSGASTVAELMAARKPALLVPFPHATDNHQLANAKVLADLGAALVVEEKEFAGRRLNDILEKIFCNPLEWNRMKRAYEGLINNPIYAGEKILNLLEGGQR